MKQNRVEGILARMQRTQTCSFGGARFDALFAPPTNGSTQHRAMVETRNYSTETLNSWKEIARYLDRGVRTIQRWEHGLGLPVHRIGKGKRSPVFATASELNVWLSTVDGSPKPSQFEAPCIHEVHNQRIQSLRESCRTMRSLSQTMAENSARQRKQATLAREQMVKLRSRISRALGEYLSPSGELASKKPVSSVTTLSAGDIAYRSACTGLSVGQPASSAIRNAIAINGKANWGQ